MAPTKKTTTKRKDPPPPNESSIPVPLSSEKRKKGGRGSSIPNFTDEEDVVLCVAYVNVSQDPIKGTDQTSIDFWRLIASKYSMEMKKAYPGLFPGTPYPERSDESLKNRFQRSIKRTTNLFMPFWKRAHDAPPSGVATEEEIIEKACEEYHDFYEKKFPFVKCLQVLKGLSNFHPSSYKDLSEDAVIDLVEQNLSNNHEGDGDKKPAPVNKITAAMGLGLTRPIGTKKAKQLLRDDSASIAGTTASKHVEAVQQLATSQHELALSQKTIANAMRLREQRENILSVYKFYKDIGDTDGVMRAGLQLEELMKSGNNMSTSPSSGPPVEAVSADAIGRDAASPGDLTGEELTGEDFPDLEHPSEEQQQT
jgi:hypothetical protein